jgi:hypothetical protein
VLLVAVQAFALCAAAVSAHAAAPIEKVWSFKGGAVAVQGLANGTLKGVVTEATTFSECVHPVGEVMWTQMRKQPDGSYWGLHQWYYEHSSCQANPTLGLTAWRVLQNEKGESYLRVCFNEPGKPQPAISPEGTPSTGIYGCVDSTPLASLPTPKTESEKPISFGSSANACVRVPSLKITLHNPKYDPFKRVVVWVNGKKVADVRGYKKLKRTIVLKHLPSGAYTVKVLGITVLGHRFSSRHSYKSCAGGSGNVKLQHSKHEHRKPKHGKHK